MAGAGSPPEASFPRWRVFPVLALGTVMATLDISVVNIALPTLSRTFRGPLTFIEWVVLAYVLAITALLLVMGRLADAVGWRRVYGTALAVFTLASALCAAAGSAPLLVAARVLQGVGAAMMSSTSLALLTGRFPAGVWLSVFNLFVVSVFWSFMADLFTPAQDARLFGVIAAGGSTGALFGPLFTTGLTYLFPVPVLMLVSALFLLACIGCICKLEAWSRGRTVSHRENNGEPLGGGFLAGVRLVWSSPYLLGICGYLTFLSMTATFLYFEQVRLVAEHFDTPEARTRLFSTLDFATNVLTWLTRLFITNRVVGSTAESSVARALCSFARPVR